jgi:hypothetical protein
MIIGLGTYAFVKFMMAIRQYRDEHGVKKDIAYDHEQRQHPSHRGYGR